MSFHSKKHKIISKYLARHIQHYFSCQKPSENTGIIVVIPVYREKDHIFRTIASLSECENPEIDVEVILLFNASENASDEILEEQKSVAETIRKEYQSYNSWLTFIVEERYGINRKHFGAGMARKEGMDIALSRLFSIGKSEGIIVSLDADSLVEPNYFIAISEWFKDPEKTGASIYFEHPIEGNEFSSEVYAGIIKYELHLRYYMQAWRETGFPYSYHTLGSAMAMRASAYARVGGMPKKQAGEDFYFLQKLIPLGNFGEINTTKVIPSPRPSDRVIFGTGAAIANHLAGNNDINLTYNYKAFLDLKQFFSILHQLYYIKPSEFEQFTLQLAKPLKDFFYDSDFLTDLEALKNNCASCEVFNKRFFELFNAFKVVKYLNFVHNGYFEKTSVMEAGLAFLKNKNYIVSGLNNERELLEFYRKLEKEVYLPVGH